LEITTYALKAQYANVYRRGCVNILDLDDDERVIFEQIVASEMSLFNSAYLQVRNGLMDDDASFDRDWKRFYLKQPGFQVIWSEIRSSYPKEFCQHLDDVQKTVEGAAQRCVVLVTLKGCFWANQPFDLSGKFGPRTT